MHQSGIEWPEAFNCDQFPKYNDAAQGFGTVCLPEPSAFESSRGSNNSPSSFGRKFEVEQVELESRNENKEEERPESFGQSLDEKRTNSHQKVIEPVNQISSRERVSSSKEKFLFEIEEIEDVTSLISTEEIDEEKSCILVSFLFGFR